MTLVVSVADCNKALACRHEIGNLMTVWALRCVRHCSFPCLLAVLVISKRASSQKCSALSRKGFPVSAGKMR